MFSLFKAIISDLFLFFKKIISYTYWNSKGVRITINCQISLKAHIARSCVFTGETIITSEASIGYKTYGHSVYIHNANIGEFCSLGPNCKVGLDEHRLDTYSTHPYSYEKLNQAKVNVKNHVWIGTNAVILAGVCIEDHSVIAAGAVVTKDVEFNSIVGGVPAKFIRYTR